MGFGDFIKGQFIDVIEHVDESNKLLVSKYERHGDEIKQGASLIVREGQAAVFICKGTLADVFLPGSYSLNTGNLPLLSSLKAMPMLFNSPIKSDLYFINTTQFIGNRWGTRSPILMRDKDFGMVRVTAFGVYAFRVTQPARFIREVFGARKMNMTYEILEYLNGFIGEAIATIIAGTAMPVLDLAADYRGLSDMLRDNTNEKAGTLGISISEAAIESIGLPQEVEKYVDEQSGQGLASKDMDAYLKYQTVRAMRDASKQKGGLAGLGAGFAFGNHIAGTVAGQMTPETTDTAETLRKYKKLTEEGVLSPEEFETLKKQLLKL